jgi:hypothetical protein
MYARFEVRRKNKFEENRGARRIWRANILTETIRGPE